MNLKELKAAAESDQIYHIVGTQIVSNPNATILKLIAVVEAVDNLFAVKGRHLTEQAFGRLVAERKELNDDLA